MLFPNGESVLPMRSMRKGCVIDENYYIKIRNTWQQNIVKDVMFQIPDYCKIQNMSKENTKQDDVPQAQGTISSEEVCKGCHKSYKRLVRHLASSSSCRAHYDFDEEKEKRRKDSNKTSQKRHRASLSEEDMKSIKEKDKSSHRIQRASLDENQKKKFSSRT